jgi:serine/threonine protein kinase
MTLYEMITLRLPFENMDNVEIIEHVCHHGPIPPRELDSAIARDLETIVLKAIARHPCDRYQTARELSHDLVRFLERKPIAARRSGRLARAWKWIERLVLRHTRANPAASSSEKIHALQQQVTALEAENAFLRERLAEADRRTVDDAAGPHYD